MLPSLNGPHSPEEVELYLSWAKRFITAHSPSPSTDPTLGDIVMDVAVDFDDTLAHSLWTPENRTREIGEPIMENIYKVHELVSHGYKIIIHTARGWEDESAIRQWCWNYDIPVHYVVCGKPIARMYVDDRALHESSSSWLDIIIHQEKVDV